MYAQIAGMFKDYEVVAVAFMVSKENIFTVRRIDISPVLHRLLDGRRCRVFVVIKANAKLLKDIVKFRVAAHDQLFAAKIVI